MNARNAGFVLMCFTPFPTIRRTLARNAAKKLNASSAAEALFRKIPAIAAVHNQFHSAGFPERIARFCR